MERRKNTKNKQQTTQSTHYTQWTSTIPTSNHPTHFNISCIVTLLQVSWNISLDQRGHDCTMRFTSAAHVKHKSRSVPYAILSSIQQIQIYDTDDHLNCYSPLHSPGNCTEEWYSKTPYDERKTRNKKWRLHYHNRILVLDRYINNHHDICHIVNLSGPIKLKSQARR